MKIAVLGDEETIWGFRLAGVKEADTTPAGFEKFLNREDILVVFYKNDLFQKLSPKIKNQVQESIQPLFVSLEGDENIGELMKKALGVEVI